MRGLELLGTEVIPKLEARGHPSRSPPPAAQPVAEESSRADALAPFRLDGRVAVVTGAAGGIGRETARVFASVGAALVLADRDKDGLAESAAAITSTSRVRRSPRCPPT